MMDSHELLALYDKELRIDVEYPGVQKQSFPNLNRFIKPAPGMNYVLYSRLEVATMDEVIQEQIAFFSTMDQPFSWHVFDHDEPPELKDHLVSHGFVTDEDDPDRVMILDLHEALPVLLEPVGDDIQRITQRDQLDDIVTILEQIYGGDFAWLKKRMSPHLEVPGYLGAYVASVEEQPACCGWVYFHPNSQFAAMFGGATIPEYRNQGLYKAILAVRVQVAIRRGYRYLTTGAGEMSQPILAKNGFCLLTHAHAYEWEDNSE